MEIGKQVISSLRWMLMSRFSGQLVSWCVTITVIRILAPSDYGLMAIATAITGLMLVLNEMGMGAALIQKQEVDKKIIAQAFGLLIVVNIALYILLFLTAPLIADFFAEQRLVSLIRVISIEFLIIPAVEISHSILARQMDFKKIAFIELLGILTSSLITLVLALAGYGVWSLVIGSLIGTIAAAIGYSVAARFFCWPSFSPRGMRHFLSFGGLVALDRVLWSIFSDIDIFLIGKVLGKEQLGFYSVSKHLASLPMEKISGMLHQVGFAAFSRIQHDQEKVQQNLRKAIQLISICIFPIFFGISAVTPELVSVLLGEKWSLAIIPLQILSLVMPLRMLEGVLPPALMGLGRADINVGNLIIGCILMPIAIFIGLQWGLFGACIAWAIAYPCYFLIVLKRALPVLGLPISNYLIAMCPAATIAMIMYIVVWGVRQTVTENLFATPIDLAILVVSGALTYGLLIFLTQKEIYTEIIAQIRR